MRAVGLDEPVFFRRGEGAYLEDVEGRRYLDWVMSWGPLIFGHADAETLAAVVEAARRGTTFGAPTEAEVELAEEIVDAVPSVEQVRLVSSGTEASMSAIRLARAFTRRDRILRFAGCYHGHVDSLLAERGLRRRHARDPSTPGVPDRRHGGHGRRALQRPRRRRPPRSSATARVSPASSWSPLRGTWASSRPSRASSRRCARSATRPARCSSSTR